MKRFPYCNLIRKTAFWITFPLFLLIGSCVLSDWIKLKELDLPFLWVCCICVAVEIVSVVVTIILNHYSKKSIFLGKHEIRWRGRSYAISDCHFRYFTFEIFDLTYVTVPRLYINAPDQVMIVYLPKRDIKKLLRIGYPIDIV